MSTKVSLIIPIYNIKDYLFECLRSAMNQSLKEIEIICVDDGSTDGSSEVLARLSSHDRRIKVIRKKNEGLGSARNTGLERATGDYIVFLDGDDFLAEKACEVLYNVGKTFDSDVILMGVWNYYSRFDLSDSFQDSELYFSLKDKNPFTFSEFPQLMRTHSVWSRVYKRSFLEENGLKNPEQRFAEDMLFSYKVAVLAKKVSVIPENLYFYRQNRKGSLLDLERKNDAFKLSYIQSAIDVKNYLKFAGASPKLTAEFYSNIFAWSPVRQNYLSSYKQFKTFFRLMKEFIGSEFSQIKTDEATNKNNLNFYLWCLKFNLPFVYFLSVKVKKILS